MPVKFTPYDMQALIDQSRNALAVRWNDPPPVVQPLTVNHLLSLPSEPAPLHGAALVAHRNRVMSEQLAKENELKLREAQVRFMRDPSGTSFIELHDRWEQVRPNERRSLFDFIVNVLRPGGLPRDGPFVWTSLEPDFEVPSPDWLKDD